MTLADKLRPHVSAIMHDAKEGSPLAKDIITLYRMHESCPGDPAAPAICEAAFDDWLNRKNEKND